MANFDLVLDLGSDFVSVVAKTDDVLVKQHSLLAIKDDDNGEILACGNGAVKLYKHNPKRIKLVRPFDECNIKNKDWFDCYFNWLFTIINADAFDNQKARILCVVPSGTNANEKKMLEAAFVNLGAKMVVFVEIPKALIKIAEQENASSSGIMVDIGSAIADFGCFVNGEMTSGCSLYMGGRQLDIAIKQFVEEQYNLHIDLVVAEKIKKQCSLYSNNIGSIFAEGKNFGSHKEERIEIPVRSLYDVVARYVNKYCGVIKSMLRSSDVGIVEKIKLGGIYLSGGVSQIEGIAEYVSKNTDLKVKVSAYGSNTVVYGARLLMEGKVFAR